MFLDNKYSKWYFSIIHNAQQINRIKTKNEYFEYHHIIPKCIEKNSNTVLLTAKEHFICHLLLTKMCKNTDHKMKMINALIRLSFSKNKKQKRYTARSFELIRKLASIRSSHVNKGRKRSDEEKQRLRNLRLGTSLNESAKQHLSSLYKGISYNERFGEEKAKVLKEKRKSSKFWSKRKKLNDNDIKDIILQLSLGINQKTLANKYKVNQSTISNTKKKYGYLKKEFLSCVHYGGVRTRPQIQLFGLRLK